MIKLKDRSRLITLGDASGIFVKLPEYSRTARFWRDVAQPLELAAHRSKMPIEEFPAVFARALKTEGLR